LKPVRKRQLMDDARATWQVSIRRACRALPVNRSTYHYRSRRAGQAHLSERIREIATTRVYRRIHVLLRREACRANAKRVYRLYREMGLLAQQYAEMEMDKRWAARIEERRDVRAHDQYANASPVKKLV
jgi:putative transposase